MDFCPCLMAPVMMRFLRAKVFYLHLNPASNYVIYFSLFSLSFHHAFLVLVTYHPYDHYYQAKMADFALLEAQDYFYYLLYIHHLELA